jgi:hypothetical protein
MKGLVSLMSKTKTKLRTELIGHCAVDSGQLMITDPSYVGYFDQTAEFGSPVPEGHFSYAGACNRTLADGHNGQMNFPAGHAGVGVVSRTGLGDGYYPVYATFADIDGWGERVVKLEVHFFNDGDLD